MSKLINCGMEVLLKKYIKENHELKKIITKLEEENKALKAKA